MPTDKPTAPAQQQDHVDLPLSMLHPLPDVFRIAFDDKSLMPLVMSVQTKGVLKPILARIREDGECEIIDGYRRKRVAELAGLKTVPVQPVTESPELAKKLHLMTHGQLSPEKEGKTVENIIADERSKLTRKPKTAAEDKTDAAKKAAPTAADKAAEKPKAPEKPAAEMKPTPDAEKKDAAPAAKTDDKKAASAAKAEDKKAASAEAKPAPADKDAEAKKAAPAEKSGEAEKPADAKPASDSKAEKSDPAKKDAPATNKPADKMPPAVDAKKAEAPAADKAAAPKPDEKAAAKPEEKTPEAEKTGGPAKPSEKKAEAPAGKPAGEKPVDKPKQAAPADKDKVAAKPAAYAEGPTGTTITKVLGEKLNPPDEKALASLPLPKEGEAYAVTLHPAYLKKAEFNHFSVDRESDDFKELYESIRTFGVKDPVLARPGKDGTLEILSGQRRHLVALELNYPVPTIIQRMDDDDARILVADGNLHRERISTYDQARAIRMKIDSMKHKAGRRKKGETARLNTDEIIAKDMGISVPKLNRLARLAEATREVCDKIDDGTLTLSVASAMSFLTPKHQEQVIGLMDLGYKVNNDRIERMKKVEKSGKLTEKAMRDILDDKDIAPKAPPVQPAPAPAPAPIAPTVSAPAPAASTPTPSTPAASAPTPNAPATPSMAPPASSIPKSPDVAAPVTPVVPFSTITAQNNAGANAPAKPAEADPFVGKQERPESTKVILSGDRLRKYFPDVNMTPREIEDKVYEAIDFYQKYQEKQKQKAAIFDKNKGKSGSAR